LALEKSKEDSLCPETPESHSRSTSPIELSIPKSNQHKPTAALKRKAPTGERDVEISISAGGSRAKPIDVDALNAVLERYPMKRESQVCGNRTVKRNIADEFSSS
jgi:hypothetical protein